MAQPNFEKDLEKLEQIVEALEEGGLSLDESLKRFEEGIKLSARCEKALADAEKKIEILVKDAAGDMEAQPFDEATGQAAPKAQAQPDAEPEPTPPPDIEDETDEDEDLLF